MKKAVLVPLADGCEELEAVTIIDLLRRAGCSVTAASCGKHKLIHGTHGTTLQADSLISRLDEQTWDLIALPGGLPGAEHLRDSPHLTDLLKTQKEQSRWIAAICAAPAVVLAQHKLIEKAKATSYPSLLKQLPLPERDLSKGVVVDKKEKIITSQGPGTAFCFALQLVKQLCGYDEACLLAEQTQAHWWVTHANSE